MEEVLSRIKSLEFELESIEYDIVSIKYINAYTINAKLKEENKILKDIVSSYTKLYELNS